MLRSAIVAPLMLLNLCFWGVVVIIAGAVKLLTFGRARRRVVLMIAWMAERWISGNNAIFRTFLDTRWDISGTSELRRDARYLAISNHASWVDILALHRAFDLKAPLIRFFAKRGVIWLPFIGQAAWALEFPFMRRYTPEYLARHPDKRGRDLETTRRACRRYRHLPVTIVNFVEGTRFTREKQNQQQSPYRNLLRPRVGGIAFVLASLGDELDDVYDVTLVYPRADVTIWHLVANRVPWVAVDVRRLTVPQSLRTDAITEPTTERQQFRQWVEEIWREKDALIDRITEERRTRPSSGK